MGDSGTLTERQKKWFESVRATFERDTGKTLEAWVEIARGCPETRPRARQQWLKDHHGLGVNRASVVLAQAFPGGAGWDQPDALKAALWADPASRAVFDAVDAAARTLPDVVCGQRKGFSAYSRGMQFAAVRPVKGGSAMLGLAVEADADARLLPRGRESWSERLKSKLPLAGPAEVDASVASLLKAAWERS